MAADLSLDELLRRIVEIARDLAGAQYAALGVLGDGPGRAAAAVHHHGMTPTRCTRSATCRSGTGCSG